MADIFLSYASEDLARVRPLVEVFEQQGWSVWWDRRIQPGQSFDNVIQRELDAARCVVVVWSENSIQSEWVKNEATIGQNRDALVPVLLDRVQVPLPFIRTQCGDLVGWKAGQDTPELRAFLEAIALNLGSATEVQLHGARAPRRRSSLLAPALLLVVLLAAFLLVWRFDLLPGRDSTPPNSIAVDVFEDLTPTYDQQWIGNTMVSILRVELPGRGFQVMGAASYGQEATSTVAAAYQLGGTVMRIGERIRVTAELVQLESGQQVWASEYYEPVVASDLSAQKKIAELIVTGVQRQVLEGEAPTLVAVQPPTQQAPALQQILSSPAAIPEFPSFDEEVTRD